MPSIEIQINDRALTEKIRDMLGRLSNPEPMLKEWGGVLIRSIARNFAQGGRPTPWHPSKRALKEGGKTLIDTKRLKNSINMRVSGNALRVGTNVKYAAIHHLGGRIQKIVMVKSYWRYIDQAFGKPIPARHTRVKEHRRAMDTYIPARPFLKIQAQDMKIMKKIVAEYVSGGR